MPRNGSKSRKPKKPGLDLSRDLWIAPRSNLRGQEGNRAWDNRGNISPDSGARFLELADVALGLKKPEIRKKKAATGTHETTSKTEPYKAGPL
jgi:hypothetical protein